MSGIKYSNPPQQGTVSSEYFAFIQHIVSEWKTPYKKLLESKNLLLILGADLNAPATGPGEIYVSKLALDIARAAAQKSDAESVKYIRSFSQTVLYNALVSVLGEGPSTIDWNVVRQEMVSRQEQNVRTQPPHVAAHNLEALKKNVSGPHSVGWMLYRAAEMFDGPEKDAARQQYRELGKAYDEYNKFVAAQSAAAQRINIIDRAIKIINALPDFIRQDKPIVFKASDVLEAKAVAAAITYANCHDKSADGHLTKRLDNLLTQHHFSYDPTTQRGTVTLLTNSQRLSMATLQVHLKTFKKMYKLNEYEREGVASEKLLFESCANIIHIAPLKQEYAKHLSPMQGRLLEMIGQHHGLDVHCSVINPPQRLPPTHPNQSIDLSDEKVKQYAKAPAPSAAPEHYKCADDLPEPQKQFFDRLNTVIKIFGISATAFDHSVKLRLAGQLSNTASLMGTPLKTQMEKDYEGIILEDTTLHKVSDLTREAVLKSILPVTIARQHEIPRTDIETLYNTEVSGNSSLQRRLTKKLFQTMMDNGLDQLINLRLPPVTNLVHDRQDMLVYLQSMLGDSMPIGVMDNNRPLLTDFMNGARPLSALGNNAIIFDWNNYRFTLPPQRTYLFSALEETANRYTTELTLSNHQKREQLKKALQPALVELKAAYEDAVLTPEEREARKQEKLAEQERLLKEQQERAELKREQDMLIDKPYGMTSRLQSIKDRIRLKKLPAKDFVDDWAQIAPLPDLLNKSFRPHEELGAALFEGQTMDILYHLCTMDAPLPTLDEAARAQTRNIAVRALSEPIDNLVPDHFKTKGLHQQLIDRNRDRHRDLVAGIANAPLLIIAALGTPELITKAKEAQNILFPGKKGKSPSAEDMALAQEELWTIAHKVLQEAFKAEGKMAENGKLPEVLETAINTGIATAETAITKAAEAMAKAKEAEAAEAAARAKEAAPATEAKKNATAVTLPVTPILPAAAVALSLVADPPKAGAPTPSVPLAENGGSRLPKPSGPIVLVAGELPVRTDKERRARQQAMKVTLDKISHDIEQTAKGFNGKHPYVFCEMRGKELIVAFSKYPARDSVIPKWDKNPICELPPFDLSKPLRKYGFDDALPIQPDEIKEILGSTWNMLLGGQHLRALKDTTPKPDERSTVAPNGPVPPDAGDPAKRKLTISTAGGWYSLVIEANYPSKPGDPAKTPVQTVIPLGLTAPSNGDVEKIPPELQAILKKSLTVEDIARLLNFDDERIAEMGRRLTVVLDCLQQHRGKASGHWLIKNDLTETLRDDIKKHPERTLAATWESEERVNLEFAEDGPYLNSLLPGVKTESSITLDIPATGKVKPRSFTIGAPSMTHDTGRKNSTWRLEVPFHYNPDTVRLPTPGLLRIYTRHLDLGTTDYDQALLRAERSLFGDEKTLGIRELLRRHFERYPKAELVTKLKRQMLGNDKPTLNDLMPVDNLDKAVDTTVEKGYFGYSELQNFVRKHMQRYEQDIMVTADEPKEVENGNVEITFSVWRGCEDKPDAGDRKQEPIYDKSGTHIKQKVIFLGTKLDKLNDFVEHVKAHVMQAARRHYAAVMIDENMELKTPEAVLGHFHKIDTQRNWKNPPEDKKPPASKPFPKLDNENPLGWLNDAVKYCGSQYGLAPAEESHPKRAGNGKSRGVLPKPPQRTESLGSWTGRATRESGPDEVGHRVI